MSEKLTPAQRTILQHLIDGDTVVHHWLSRGAYVRGEWGRKDISLASIDKLILFDYVDKYRVGDFYHLTITDAGRAALEGGSK